MSPKHFSPADLDVLEYPAWLCLSFDGSQAAYSLFSPRGELAPFGSRVCVINIADGSETLLDTGGNEDLPQFSPADGNLAFLCDKSGEHQIWLQLPDGSIFQLTTLRHGVTRYSWSPDGKQVVFEAPLWPEEMECPFTPMTAPEKQAWQAGRENSPVVIEDLMYKFDESYGIVDGSIPCIGVVDTGTGAARLLTRGEMPFHCPAFSPDGTSIACYGKPYGHHKARRDEVFLLPAAGGTPKQLTQNAMCSPIAPPVFAPDGEGIIYAAYQGGDDIGGFLTRLFQVPVAGGEARGIMPQSDDTGVDNAPHGRSAYGTYNPIFQASRCGNYVYYMAAYMGGNHLYRLNLKGEPAIVQISAGEGALHCFCPPAGDVLLFSRAGLDSLCQLYVVEGGKERLLTDCNAWSKEYAPAPWRELWVNTRDGKSRVQGWVLSPPDLKPDEKVPALLNVHGGPTISFVRDFNLEAQAQAASGHAVLLCNPRGSSGYGMAFADSALAWGQEAIDDLNDFVQAAVDLGFIDGDRIGITGGSYGGYMTLKIIGRSKTYKAACAQRALCNTTTSYGTGDMGFLSGNDKMPTMMDFLINRVKSSYINQVDNISAPLLLLHGTNDYRCSFEQAEQMFIAMKERRPDIPVRLIAFPQENHQVSRTGRILSQRVHMQEMIDWFTRYLVQEVADHA